jgi:carbon storage regulator CsrA
MLHLNRKPNESIYIIDNETGHTVELVILEVKGKTVKLGFENADRSSTILRKEIKQKKENHDNPNPYYKDKIPQFYRSTPRVEETPNDGLEKYLDTIIPATDTEEPATSAAA